MKHINLKYLVILFPTLVFAQSSKGPMDFPELEFTKIKGAPILSSPKLVTGTLKPVITEGYGLAAPAFYDWDGDGTKDLLIGEFASGEENGKYAGNFLRLFKNEGTLESPEFTGLFSYARSPFEILSDGTPYSVDQYCCIGFTPQFVDLNHDSIPDMITGQYYGEVSWFQGSSQGFLPGKALQQTPPNVGHPRINLKGKPSLEKKEHQYYWIYSSASFGDFTGDGNPDLIIGGRELRISKNIGTATEPKFAQREPLLDTNGNTLKVYEFTQEELKFYEQLAFLAHKPPISGDGKLSPYVVDWDQDGVLDLLVTNSYSREGLAAVDFFKGIQIKEGHRFQPAIPLFNVNGRGKALPGSAPRIAVTDWNSDGVNDLLIGISVLTVNGEFNDRLSWSWEKDEGNIKDPATIIQFLSASQLQQYKETAKVPEGITWDEYITVRHHGYVYVMLGNKE